MTELLVRGGDVVQREGIRHADVRITNDRVSAVAPALSPEPGETVLDADGLLVLPGVIDCHTHLALDTGKMATRDDFVSGSISAAAGGVTTVVNFAPQRPRQALIEAVAAERAKADGKCLVDYALHVCVGTPGPGWERELDELSAAGVTSLKVHTTYRDTMFYTRDWDWYRLAQACAKRDLLVMVHCENDDIVTGATEAILATHRRSFASHAAARPAVAEVEADAFDALKPGATLGALYDELVRSYARSGHPGGERNHHQGGPCGYLSRDAIALPRSKLALQRDNAAAFNPSLPGAKIEDTVLVREGGVEILTFASGWPMREVRGRPRPDLLVR